MATPQPGIFALGTRTHHHLQFDITGAHDELLDAIADIRDAATTVAGVNLVVGFAPSIWAAIAPAEAPVGIDDFAVIAGPGGYTFPATQRDLWIWFHGSDPSPVFDAVRVALLRFDGLATLVDEQHGFTYGASQDLTGFEDGTENPPLDEAVGLIGVPDGEPGAGASVTLVQRWVHDLDAFAALDHHAQEQIIGRTLEDSEELSEGERGSRAHISRVVIEDEDGEEREVFRRSVAYGGADEHGLVFVAFAPDDRLQTMLERMAGIGDGKVDHLTDISTPATSAWFITPSVDQLLALRD